MGRSRASVVLRRGGRPAILATAAAAGLAFGAGRVRATTYTYVGPFTGTGTAANPFSNPASWSTGTVPNSAADTALVFNNFDANTFAVVNNVGSPFLLNSVTFNNESTTNGALTLESLSGNSLELTGTSPTITSNGPSNDTFGVLLNGSTGATGLILAPTSGTTTVAGAGNGIVTIGSSAAVITGTGGLTINQTGLGYVSLFGTNTFAGGVTLNSGSLQVGTAGALGAAANTLTINGGNLRGSASFANNVTANADLLYVTGTSTLSGVVSGAGGVHLTNGLTPTTVATQSLTLSGADAYAGATTVDAAPVQSLSSSNLATLTVSGTIANSSAITVGNGGTLAFTGSSNNTRVSDTAPVTLSGARLSVSGLTASTAFNETFGTLAASGQNTFTISPQTSGTAVANTLTFGPITRSDNATLFFRGTWLGATTSYGYGQANFSGGLANVSDPAAANAGAGTDLGVVPYASGSTTSTTAQAPNAFVTYNASAGSIQLVPITGANVAQAATPAALAAVPDQNVNLNTASSSAAPFTLTGSQTVGALSNSATTYLAGGQAVTVASGTVVTAAGLTLSAATLNFGTATGYVHLGNQLTVNGTSQITGSGGIVLSGAPYTTSGGIANEIAQFANSTVGNPFTGGLTVNGTNVQFTADNELGAAGGGVTLNGGALIYNTAYAAGSATDAVTLNRPIRLGSAGGNVQALSGETVTLAGNITGPGGLSVALPTLNTVNGPTVVALTGTNGYAGPTYVANGTLDIGSDANLGAGPVQLSSTLQFAGPTTLTHTINLIGGGIVDTNGNAVALSGSITGSVNGVALTKVGGGTLSLTAAEPTLSNGINASGGTIAVSGNGALPQVTNLIVASGATLAVDNTATNLPDRLADLARVTIPAGGTFQYIGNASAASTETFGGINLTTAGTATVEVDGTAATLTSSGVVAGVGTLTKAGTGTLVLSPTLAASNFSGGMTVNGGTVRTAATSSLGFGGTLAINTTPGPTAVASGAALDLGGQTITEPVALAGGSLLNSSATPATLTSGVKGTSFSAGGVGYAPTDTVSATGGTGALAAVVLGLTTSSINITNGGDYSNLSTLPAVSITGGGGSGATAVASTDPSGSLIITVVNPGSGYTSAPTVTLVGGSGTPNQAATFAGDATGFTVVGLTQTAAGTGYNSASAAVVNTTTGSGLTIGSPVVGSLALTATSSVGGSGNLTVQPGISGSGGLVKVGPGTVTLTASGSYTGGTTVSAGTLRANATTATGSGAVVIASGGTLGGNGSTGAATVAAGGTITAGPDAATTGTLTTGAEAWNASGGLLAKVSAAGTANDVLVMSGLTISASNAPGGRFNVTVTSTGTPTLASGSVLVIADDKESAASNPFGPSFNTSTLAALTLSVAGLQSSTGAFTLGTQSDSLGNGGYDLILETTAAPEPTSLLMAGLAAAPLALGRRRRVC